MPTLSEILDQQKSGVITPAEEDSKISVIESILAGIGSGLIAIPKGIVSLGAELMDLGADTNKAAEVEKWFDDLTEWDEKAEATAAGKIAEVLVNVGIPGTIGFKVGSALANKAFQGKKLGKYFKISDDAAKQLAKTSKNAELLNTKGRTSRFIAGAVSGGISEGIFIGDVEKTGSLGDLLGGPTAIDREDPNDPARSIINRIKFGTEGALFTGLLGGIGKTIKALSTRRAALEEADNTIDKFYNKVGSWLEAKSGKPKGYFSAARSTIGLKRKDIQLAQDMSRQLNIEIDSIFPYLKRTFDQSTKDQKKEFLELLNNAFISGRPKYVGQLTGKTAKKAGDQAVKEMRKLKPDLTAKEIEAIRARATGAKVEFNNLAWGNLSQSVKKPIIDFMKKRNDGALKDVDVEKITNIFGSMNAMRQGWGRIFTTLARNLDSPEAKKLLSGKSLKEFKNLFGDKFKNYLSATYDVFQNKPLIPLLRYRPAREAIDKFISVTRYLGDKSGVNITKEEAESIARQIIDTADAPKRFDMDAKVNLPAFYTSKSLASIKKLPKIERTMVPKKGTKGAGWEIGALDDTQKIRIGKDLKVTKKEAIEELLGKTRNPIDTILAGTEKISQVTRGNLFLNKLILNSGNAIKTVKNKAGKVVSSTYVRPALLYPNEKQFLKAVDDLTKLGKPLNPDNYRKVDVTKSPSGGLFNEANGRWARREVADAIEDAAGTERSIAKATEGILNNPLYQYLVLVPKAAAQVAKTILSPVTHIRNLVSAGAFAAANGIIPFIHYNPKMMAQTFKKLNVGLPGSRQQMEAYRELVELGVVNTNVSLGDLRGLLQDVNFGTAFSADRGMRGIMKPLSRLKKWTEDMYTAEDDFWKIGTFAAERIRLGRAYEKAGVERGTLMRNFAGDMVEYNENFIKHEAAHIVRNNVPNYDYVSETIKGIRKLPIGNFMAFPAEIMRTSANIVKRALDEISTTMMINGRQVRPLASVGMQRLIGFGATAAAVPYGAVKLGQTLYDISDEELEAVRRYVAYWSKNSTLVPVRNGETGNIEAVDFSRANAYDLLVRPIQTVINQVAEGEKDNNGMMDDFIFGSLEAMYQVMAPFITESIWTEAVLDLSTRRGQTVEGTRVWNEEDTPGNRIKDGFFHLAYSLAPFSWQQLERLDYAIEPYDVIQLVRGKPGKYDPTGQSYELGKELLGLMGMRPAPVNVKRSLTFKISDYQRRIDKSRGLFTKALKGGPVTAEELVDAYINSNRALYDTQKEMSLDIEAAKVLGEPSKDLYNTFIERMPRAEFYDLEDRRFDPYEPSRSIEDKIANIARATETINPYKQASSVINSIRKALARLKLVKGQQFPNFSNPFKEVRQTQEQETIEKISNVQGDVTTNLQSNIMPPPGSAPASTNLASFSGQVGPDGLTRNETALLSPDEQAIRRQQRRMG